MADSQIPQSGSAGSSPVIRLISILKIKVMELMIWLGMNGSITQCDCLSRKATRAFFIRNDTPNYLGFSEVIELPKNQEVADLLGVHWD